MGIPSVARAPEVRVERTAEAVILWFLSAEAERPVQRVVVPAYTVIGDDEDPETAELGILAHLQGLGYDARRVDPGATPPRP